MRLVAKRLHHADAADILLKPHIERADAAELVLPVAGHARAITGHHQRGQRHDEGGDEGELRVHPEHQQEGADKGHHRDEHVLGTVMGDLADLFQILGDAGDQMAGLEIIVEPERQLLQVLERAGTHFGLDIDAEHVAPIGDDGHQPAIERVNHQQRGGGQHDELQIGLRQQLVDKTLHRHGKAEFQQPGQHGAAEVDQEQPAVWPVIGEEGFQHVISFLLVSPARRRAATRPRPGSLSCPCRAPCAAGFEWRAPHHVRSRQVRRRAPVPAARTMPG